MEKHLRILAFFIHPHVIYGKIVGGVERRFLELSTRLKAEKTKIFALEYTSSLSQNWGYKSYQQIKINQKFRNNDILEVMRLTIYGITACLRFKCNLIYVPGARIFKKGNITILSPFLVSLLCRKPLVIVFHHLTKSDYNIRNPIVLLAYFYASACIAVSKATAKDLLRNFKLRRVSVIGNGVNFEKFRYIHTQTKAYDTIYFGRISEEKGIKTLLKAWKIVIKKIPTGRLLLMGGTNKTTRYQIEKLAEKLGIHKNVTISGFVSDPQAIRMLNTSRIFVLPSTEEGFGLAVLEAMAAGLPCILSDIPALRENFHSAAVFVEPQNPSQLAQAILTLLSNPEKRRKLACKGQKLVKQFSWDTVAEKELKVLRSVINP